MKLAPFILLAAWLPAAAQPASALPASAQSPAGLAPLNEPLTLERTLRLALENSGELLSAEQDVIIAQQRVKEASYLFLPQTSINGAVIKSNIKYPQVFSTDFTTHLLQPSDQENFYSVRALVTQPLYTGGRNKNVFRLAKASLMQAKTRYEAVRRDVTLETKEAFFKLRHGDEAAAAAKEWLETAKKIAAQLRLSSWEGIEGSALINRMESACQLAQKQLGLQKLELLRALNKELNAAVGITGEFKPLNTGVDLPKLTVWAMELRPELKGEVYKAEMDAIAVNLAMSRRLPTVTFGASYDLADHTFPLRYNSWEAALSIHFPLSYDFWTQILQKKAEQRQGDLKRAGLQDRVRLELRQACDNLVFWQAEVVNRQSAYAALRADYDKNSGQAAVSLAALRATEAVWLAQSAWLEAVREQLLARAKLEWALGQDLPGE